MRIKPIGLVGINTYQKDRNYRKKERLFYFLNVNKILFVNNLFIKFGDFAVAFALYLIKVTKEKNNNEYFNTLMN